MLNMVIISLVAVVIGLPGYCCGLVHPNRFAGVGYIIWTLYACSTPWAILIMQMAGLVPGR